MSTSVTMSQRPVELVLASMEVVDPEYAETRHAVLSYLGKVREKCRQDESSHNRWKKELRLDKSKQSK